MNTDQLVEALVADRAAAARPIGRSLGLALAAGIGLSLVHGLVQRLGGAIAAGPAPEGGAAFTVFLADAP